ncbi:tetratricopeptide repeat protein 5 isoform X2 [Brachypodium distachyon]|uniref:tetratricopeptide repeat protein 5 isoform X2 n=1 Tax=Brachypodium distachyon TaxID=15368 RepID=UPI000D0CE3A3|nr:tetratricopeptide repeat protein 5 isoform X2 [Brachypodium distachyon]|eukprot:XP_024315538.1 tetratricopeptide repeat protein 5 isoform X2 [Brachypodium distachyon]
MRREASGAAASSASGLEPQRQQGEGKHVAEARRTLLEKTADTVEELYHLRDTFFPRDPTEKPAALRACADAALAVLDSLPAEQRKSPQQRAVYEFLMGKILDVFPDYHKEAEEHLSKAVKLNPSLIDAWLCLGNCIWKKGDLESAKNCFLSALSKGSDKRILCQLSMLERSMAQDNLGNAYLTSFFVSGAWDHAKLHHSVKAYQNAEKDETMKLNPDLYYNCATAEKYLENYESALRGFEAAALKDPGLSADTEVQKIISILDKLDNATKRQLRPTILASSVSSLSEVNSKLSHKKVTINILSEGLNKTVAVLGKVALLIRHDNVAPLYYLSCDLDQSYFILSVYGLRSEAIKEGDRVALLEPYYRIMDISWKGQRYKFKSIRVDFPEQIRINEKAPAAHHVVRASIHAHNKS